MHPHTTRAPGALLCAAVFALTGCGGGGSSPSAATPVGATTAPAPAVAAPAPPPAATGSGSGASGKAPVDYRPVLLASLVGTYSSPECIDLVSSQLKPGSITVGADGTLTINGAAAGSLYEPDIAVHVQRSDFTDMGGTAGLSFQWFRDVKSKAPEIYFQVTGPTTEKGQTGVTAQAWGGSAKISCFVPGNLGSFGKPAFFAAQKYLEADVKDWHCVDGVNKPSTLVLGAYKNAGGEAVLGGEVFSAALDTRDERIILAPPNAPDPASPNRGQALSYTLATKGGRQLHAFYDDAGGLTQVGGAKSPLAANASQPLNPYVCTPKAP